jgi:hypothetical protein
MNQHIEEQKSAPWKRVTIWHDAPDGRSEKVAGAWLYEAEAAALIDVENAARAVLSFAGWHRPAREASRVRLVNAVQHLDAVRRGRA